jgi:hypothetical protein
MESHRSISLPKTQNHVSCLSANGKGRSLESRIKDSATLLRYVVKAESKTVAKLLIEKANLDVSGPSGRTLHDALDSGMPDEQEVMERCHCIRQI